MGSLTLAAIVFAVVFVGGAIGLELQRRLPESFTTGGPRDMTGAVVGLMTLLLALVLGLLIWTAYGVFSTQKASVQTLAITDLKLDEAFQDYGPEAAEGHRILREGIKNTIAEIWKHSDDEQAVIHKFGYARANLKARTRLAQRASACVGPTDSGKNGGDASRDRDRPDARADDARPGRSHLVFAHQHRGGLGGVPLLRLRPFVESAIRCRMWCSLSAHWALRRRSTSLPI